MSRLDSFINRMSAQRDMLNHIRDHCELPPESTILEIGLGNGRTFNHIRENFPHRRIVAFDRQLGAHKSSIPDDGNLVLGEIDRAGKPFMTGEAAFVHADIGTGYPEKDAVTLTWLPSMVAAMLLPGGYALSGLPLDNAQLQPLPVLPHIEPDRYFFYRKIL
ncbi:class I SAM-dependent methyltransferase [Allorhizobium undicola]|uniref:class I SAM-dependent methyltransferase n=1 Tax=Allorhizobium undicola TaxID=78527 RepID=UPI0004870B6C|nr:class I SAM-dependent methyltransferase [Allorhizobium undicola]